MSDFLRIDDFEDPRLDVFTRLTGAQLRNRLEPEKGVFIAESPTVIEVAMDGGCIPTAFLTDERLISGSERIIERIRREFPEVPIYIAGRDILSSLTGFELTRGALCAMKRKPLVSPEELCRDAKRIAVLEEIADSTNIGAIFRSAAALGIDAVLLTPTSCDPLCRRALRVSMGTVLQVPWTRVCENKEDWLDNGASMLRSLGFKTAAMALTDNSVSIEDPTLLSEERLAIILGAEGDGLAKSTISKCDYTVKIPMSHGVDSLNVAAASAVAFWQMRYNKTSKR